LGFREDNIHRAGSTISIPDAEYANVELEGYSFGEEKMLWVLDME